MTEPAPIRVENSTRQLKHEYSMGEKADLGHALSVALKGKAGLADELSAVKAQYKHREAESDATINSLANKITTGFEMREIPIQITTDLNRGLVIIRRMDTQEVVEERPVRDEERQLILEVTKDSATDTIQKGMDILTEAGAAAAAASETPAPEPITGPAGVPCTEETPCCGFRGRHRHPGWECLCECHCHICDCEPPDAPPEESASA